MISSSSSNYFKQEPSIQSLLNEKPLLCWIQPEQLYWNNLSGNPEAMHLFNESHFDIVRYDLFSMNTSPDAIEMLRKYPHKINWNLLSANPTAMSLLKENMENISWIYLSKNPNPEAIQMIEEHMNQTGEEGEQPINTRNWMKMWIYANPNALHLFDENRDKWSYHHLSSNTNPEIIQIIDELIDSGSPYAKQLNWSLLSANPAAINIIKKNMDKISWNYLSVNPEAIDILEENQSLIDWFKLSENPAIFIKESYVLK
jgi:hypothetical protein